MRREDEVNVKLLEKATKREGRVAAEILELSSTIKKRNLVAYQ